MHGPGCRGPDRGSQAVYVSTTTMNGRGSSCTFHSSSTTLAALNTTSNITTTTSARSQQFSESLLMNPSPTLLGFPNSHQGIIEHSMGYESPLQSTSSVRSDATQLDGTAREADRRPVGFSKLRVTAEWKRESQDLFLIPWVMSAEQSPARLLSEVQDTKMVPRRLHLDHHALLLPSTSRLLEKR